MAVTKKSEALNALHNIIYSSDVAERRHFVVKIDNAIEQLSFMLSAYLDKIYDVSNRYRMAYGLNINTMMPETEKHPKPENASR